MASPRTKYKEYKRKMEEWSKLFEQEYGFAPTDDDRLESNTYNALLEKARHYRAHIAEGAVPRSPDRKSRGKSSRNASTPSGTRSKASRSDRHGGAQRNTSAPPMRAGRSGSNHRESRAGSSSHRSPSKRTESNGGMRASPTKSPSGRKGTRSLGVDVSALLQARGMAHARAPRRVTTHFASAAAQKVGIEVSSTSEKVGTVGLAYAVHKAASPIRFPPTVALTPVVARTLFGKKDDDDASADEAAE